MPCVLRTRNLLEQRSSCLKKNRVGEHHNSAGGIKIQSRAGQFHQVKPYQAYVDDIAGDSGNANAVANADAVAADNKEIGGNRKKDRLQSHRDTRGDESGKGRKRTEFTDKAQNQDDDDQKTNDDAPQNQKLAPAPRIVDVAEGDAPPDFGDRENHSQGKENSEHAKQNGAKNVFRFVRNGISPLVQIGLAVIEHNKLLAEGQD